MVSSVVWTAQDWLRPASGRGTHDFRIDRAPRCALHVTLCLHSNAFRVDRRRIRIGRATPRRGGAPRSESAAVYNWGGGGAGFRHWGAAAGGGTAQKGGGKPPPASSSGPGVWGIVSHWLDDAQQIKGEGGGGSRAPTPDPQQQQQQQPDGGGGGGGAHAAAQRRGAAQLAQRAAARSSAVPSPPRARQRPTRPSCAPASRPA
jgi:hypothetical protein